ncbi:hypothetical protein [Lelliottia amnigena]|uniref:hypothetical protein n=1 Tax=Lelliottia amnigena TaxID=61646 RepID=UPI00293BB90A|nr:hypothetical protein [Lelliottia amnigena]
MPYDEFEREQETIDFINNKINKCRRELHYKEKFYNVGNICNPCKGLLPFIDADAINNFSTSSVQYNNLEPLTSISVSVDNNIDEKRTLTERELLKKYPEWQLKNELALKEWREKCHETPAGEIKKNKSTAELKIEDERIGELLNRYDSYRAIDITQEEVISLLWEVMYYRKISTKY